MDGIKYLDYSVPGAYAAKLQAFTYPDELDGLIGNTELYPGLTVYDQRAGPFHLSYRTKIANDVAGTDFAYNVHLIYNVTATQGDSTFGTISEQATGSAFEWNLVGVPNLPSGFHPSSHFSADSRRLPAGKLGDLENYIYGTPSTAPAMPDFSTLVSLVT
jgi:hypothetical protein